MNKFRNKLLVISVIMLLTISMIGSVCFAADPISVKVRIQGYEDGTTGEILDEYTVTLTDTTGFTALDAFYEACDNNSISYTENSGYVSSIDGQSDSDYSSSYYGGWMYRVWESSDQPNYPDEDSLASVGAAQYTLSDGDCVTWYYALPEYTNYTIMSNYSSILSEYDEGASISVNAKAEAFEDVWNWTLSGYEDLSGATIKIERISDGTILASGTTDSNGDVSITAPTVSSDTDCYIYVDSKYYTAGSKADAIKHVKSWRKEITIKNVN